MKIKINMNLSQIYVIHSFIIKLENYSKLTSFLQVTLVSTEKLLHRCWMCVKTWVSVDIYVCLCNKLRQINLHKWFRKLWNVRQQSFINWQYSRKPCSLFITNGRLFSNHLEITLCHLFIPDDYITDLIISVYQSTNRIKETGNWKYFFPVEQSF